jgi:hypothetical protein
MELSMKHGVLLALGLASPAFANKNDIDTAGPPTFRKQAAPR